MIHEKSEEKNEKPLKREKTKTEKLKIEQATENKNLEKSQKS